MVEQHKLNEFEPVSYEAWLELVARDLQGAPFEKKLVKRIAGLDIKPLYTRADAREREPGWPGFAPYTRGCYALGPVEMGWDVRVEVAQGEPEQASRRIVDQLNGGATSLALVFDRAARLATREYGVDGVAIENVHELDAVLSHVALDKVPIAMDAGATALPVAAGWVALAKRRRIPFNALSGGFGVDPLGTLASSGGLPTSLDAAFADAAEVARWASQHVPKVRALTVDTSPYHDAGADAAFEIALALATGVEYLRALAHAGLTVDQAAQQLLFQFSVGRDFFVEIAKLRAARRTWARVVEAAGGGLDAQTLALAARTSRRTKTQRDPWVNLLRGTAETLSAVLGGADSVATAPFDAALGESDEFAERMARNTQHLLRHEGNVQRVVDPVGGSWYVEAITDGLAQRAWQRFQAIERAGGAARAIIEGSVQAELKSALEAERKAVAARRVAITGVNEFPHVREEPLTARAGARERNDELRPISESRAEQRAQSAAEASSRGLSVLKTENGARFVSAIDAAERGAAFSALRAALAVGSPTRATALVRERLAEPFEALRDRADLALATRGKRPTVFLANLGPIPEHKARAGFAHNFFEAGGFAVLSNDGFATAEAAAAAFQASGADIAALCSSDVLYGELAEPAARALRAAGARSIVLAGQPGEREAAYRTAGVSDFIYVGIDAVDALRSLLERTGGA